MQQMAYSRRFGMCVSTVSGSEGFTHMQTTTITHFDLIKEFNSN